MTSKNCIDLQNFDYTGSLNTSLLPKKSLNKAGGVIYFMSLIKTLPTPTQNSLIQGAGKRQKRRFSPAFARPPKKVPSPEFVHN